MNIENNFPLIEKKMFFLINYVASSNASDMFLFYFCLYPSSMELCVFHNFSIKNKNKFAVKILCRF